WAFSDSAGEFDSPATRRRRQVCGLAKGVRENLALILRPAAALALLVVLAVAGCSDDDSRIAVPTATPTVAVGRLTGTCLVPGNGDHGLTGCTTGTPITVFRCDDRTQCLRGQGLTVLGTTTVASGGNWSTQIPAADASSPLIFKAGVAEGIVYSALG